MQRGRDHQRFSSAEEMSAALRSAHHTGEVTERRVVERRSVAAAPVTQWLAAVTRRQRLNPMVAVIPLGLAICAFGLAAFGLPGATSARAVPVLAGQPIESARAAAASARARLGVRVPSRSP